MISDEMLWVAATEADQLILNALPDAADCCHAFSRSFERKMDRPVYRATPPVVYKVLKTAAIFILVCTMLFAGVLAVSPQVRATVTQWLKSVQAGVSWYFYTGEQITDMDKEYYLSYIPEGYTLYEESSTANSKSYIYINDVGQLLDFTYMYGNGAVMFTTENSDHHTVSIGNVIADLYLTHEGYYGSSTIAWLDPDTDMLFIIGAFADQDGLIQLAESVKEK